MIRQADLSREPARAAAPAAGRSAQSKPHVPRLPWAPLQRRATAGAAAAEAPNRTGLPDALKAGIEALSGIALDDVRVHRESSEPAKLGALAYAQGGDIHLGPGQESHLPHEAWHVVQQKRGQVAPTFEARGLRINDDAALEAEADRMGRLALGRAPAPAGTAAGAAASGGVVQRKLPAENGPAEVDPAAYQPDKGQIHKAAAGGKASGGFSVGFRQHMFTLWAKDGIAVRLDPATGGWLVRSMPNGVWVLGGGCDLDHITAANTVAAQLVDAAQKLDEDFKETGIRPPEPWQLDYFSLFNGASYVGWNVDEPFKPKKRTPETKAKELKDRATADSKLSNGLAGKEPTIRDNSWRVLPTAYGASLYYHDMPNLQPMIGSENSAKGKKDLTQDASLADPVASSAAASSSGPFLGSTLSNNNNDLSVNFGSVGSASTGASVSSLGTDNPSLSSAFHYNRGFQIPHLQNLELERKVMEHAYTLSSLLRSPGGIRNDLEVKIAAMKVLTQELETLLATQPAADSSSSSDSVALTTQDPALLSPLVQTPSHLTGTVTSNVLSGSSQQDSSSRSNASTKKRKKGQSGSSV